jgi:hypothetical protein
MKTSVTLLSVTEAEFVSRCQAVQDMLLFAIKVLESIGLKVKKPMSSSSAGHAVCNKSP